MFVEPIADTNWQIVGPVATAAAAIHRGIRQPEPVDATTHLWAGTAGAVVEVSFGSPPASGAGSAWLYINTGAATQLQVDVLQEGRVLAATTVPANSPFAWVEIRFNVPAGGTAALVMRFTAAGGYDTNVRAAYLEFQDIAAGDPHIRVVGITDKIRPQTTLAPDAYPASAQLLASGNEYAAFQIVASATDRPLPNLTVAVGAFATNDGHIIDSDCVRPFRVTYYRSEQETSGDAGPNPTGLWPDPLIPAEDPLTQLATNAFPVDVPQGENRIVWIDVFVPPGTAAGFYQGKIHVTADGLAVDVPVQLEVLAFTLPATASLSSGFGVNLDALQRQLKDPTLTDEQQRYQTQQMLVRLALMNGLTAADQWPLSAGGDQPLFEDRILPLIIGGDPLTRPAGAKMTSVWPQHRLGTDELDRWMTESRAHDFESRCAVYDRGDCDEITGQVKSWMTCRQRDVADVEARWPQAAVLLTAQLSDLENWRADLKQTPGPIEFINQDHAGRILLVTIVDQMDPHGGTSQRSLYDAGFLAKSPQNRLWLYSSNSSYLYPGCVGYQIDASGAHVRALAWLCFNRRVSGELYYETVGSLASAWAPGGLFIAGGNGADTLFYPGIPGTELPDQTTYQGPLTLLDSIRVKLRRQGCYDFVYLAFLQSHSSEVAAVQQISDALVPHPYCANDRTDADFTRARNALIDHLRPLLPATAPEPPLTL